MTDFSNKYTKLGLTFDDVLLIPAKSEVTPDQVQLGTDLTPSLHLNIPILSAAMDTVTESPMAIQLALNGGLGVIHKNMLLTEQAKEVSKVKQAVIDFDKYPDAATDEYGRLIVAAGVGVTNDTLDRVKDLVEAGADAIIVDSAHGHSEGVLRKIREIRETYPTLNIIGGNIATGAGAQAIFEAGADVAKVGIGPGSICTTRVVAGVGVPQITAITDAAEVSSKYKKTIIADGGAKWSGDIVKAIAAGGNAVMLGSMLAGTQEAPGEVIVGEDGNKYKTYRGMGSMAAMQNGSKDRYFQGEVKEVNKLVPEGIEAVTAYKGTVDHVIFEDLGGLRAGMGYTGSATIKDLIENAQFVRITNAGLVESHPHDVHITKQAPNYVRV
ncbi:guanosine monophosphate reductase [Oenococcus oeni]|uniref:IMP dehydrogenase n=1 Tax=Oenococcus oeni TaxID=1247 RepID=UPI0008F93BC0|nr:IMP dehydrogenase [Oenococcus oeni]AWW99407.1 guanosine monophosphate reductase [Oenococcus oeni]OIL50708.1 guanosine monophosphate reductase [Oenococcus oeni]OIL52080.1 guanosine monophosphate reductase [Oenococcus oeni]OIL62694.1 guanosine monophosphate reductase [Oenococcus oeni]OIL68071.1 guanosine monophosphate reductase [Oenococcus oeni]